MEIPTRFNYIHVAHVLAAQLALLISNSVCWLE